MFAQLALLVAAGLLGPLLSAGRRGLIPVVVGELAIGVILGRTGLHLLDAGAQPLPVFFQVGFVMLMLTAGTHVNPREAGFRQGVLRGSVALALVGVMAVPAGAAMSAALGVHLPLLLMVLLAGSSAAVAFPMIEERHLAGPAVSFLIAWIAIADTITVVLMPLSLTGSGRVVTALLGDALVVACGAMIMVLARRLRSHRRVDAMEERSVARGWALQLRLSVLVLLALAAIAERTGGSNLVAGFVAGMILVQVGEPDRLQLQVSGVANGFFVPIFFVLLGAELNLRALAGDPRAMALAVCLGVAAVAIHVLAGLLAGTGERLAAGLASSAQLGLPAAAASLGLASHALSPAVAAALVAAGCLTIIPATIGSVMLASPPAPPSRSRASDAPRASRARPSSRRA